MEQYILKSAVVAEIDKRIADNKKDIERASHKNLEDYFKGYEDALVLFKEKFLDTLEVKEVDLNKYINKYFKGWYVDLTNQGNILHTPDGNAGLMSVKEVAKHFFELGLKAQKGGNYDRQR